MCGFILGVDVGNFFATISILATHQWALGPFPYLGRELGGPEISRDSMRGVGSQDKATRVGIGADALDNH